MSIEEDDALARRGDMGLEASAIRLRAAWKVTGISEQKDLAEAAGLGKTALNNMMKGRSYPNRSIMKFMYRRHRIDFNFLMYGDLSYVDGDVRDRLIPALRDATNEWDHEAG